MRLNNSMIEHITKHSLLWSLDISIRELKASYDRYTTFGRCTIFPLEFLFAGVCVLVGTVTILVSIVLDKLLFIHISRAFRFVTKGLHELFFKY